MNRFSTITVNPEQMGGVPCIRGLRIPVKTIMGLIAAGFADDEILSEYPDLTAADLDVVREYSQEYYPPAPDMEEGVPFDWDAHEDCDCSVCLPPTY